MSSAGSFQMRKSAVFHDAAGSEAPQLPAELWEHVFWHLSVKDWACAAATCTAFWALQPYRAGMCRMCLDRACSSGAAGAASEVYKAVVSTACITNTTVLGQSGMPYMHKRSSWEAMTLFSQAPPEADRCQTACTEGECNQAASHAASKGA